MARPAKGARQVEAFAEDLGRMLGTARAKADSWLGQRKEITKVLSDIRDTASKLLNDLGTQAQAVGRGYVRGRRGPGRPPKNIAANNAAPRKRRRLSAKARKAISDAQKARWARQRAAERKQ